MDFTEDDLRRAAEGNRSMRPSWTLYDALLALLDEKNKEIERLRGESRRPRLRTDGGCTPAPPAGHGSHPWPA